MAKKILLLAAACVVAFAANAAEYVTEIPVLKGEKWWGLDYLGRLEQPLQGGPSGRVVNSSSENYKSVMVSNAGRYIYSENPINVIFDNEKFTITSNDEKIEVQKGGKTLREAYVVCALKNFTLGQSPDPDMFALPMYETQHEFGYALDEETIVGYAEKLLAEGFPAGIMVVADGWQKVSGPYEFDPELYPDPKRMVDRLHTLGFKVMLTVTPFVPMWGKVYAEAKRNNQIHSDVVGFSRAVLDIGDATQFERLKTGVDKIKAEYGFDGFCFDGGRADSENFINNMMSLRDDMTFVLYKDAPDMPYAPYMGNRTGGISEIITAGLMGYPYIQASSYHMDAQGPRKMADYLLLQCGMPVVSIDFAPWNITDPKLYQGVKDALNFRASIGDYMRKLVLDSRRTGEPLARHMEYQFPNSSFFDCTDQFMLGPKYLFAPCVDGADKRMVRFPKGTWIGRGGEKIKGPVVKQVDCSGGGLICFELAK